MKLIKFLLVIVVLAAIGGAAAVKLAPAETAAYLVDLKRKIGGLEVKRLTLDNGMTYVYMEAGTENAETLLLLHGFGADKDNFTEVAPYLKDFHLIIPDHIGFGESSNPSDVEYTPVAQALRLHELMLKLNIDSMHIGGSSMGGQIAMTYASLYPGEVKSLWLLDPGGLWSGPESEMMEIIEKTGSNPLTATTPDEYRQVFSLVMSKPPFVPGFILDEKAKVRISNFALEQKIFKDIKSDNTEERIVGLTTPTLLVWGAEDRVLHPGSVAVVEDLMPNVTSIIMPGIGHLPMLEAPKQTATDLKAFLGGI